MLIRLMLIAFLAPSATPGDIETRAQALRADLAVNEPLQPQTPRITLERQLLISLERRRDLERVQSDAKTNADNASDTPEAPPKGLLEADDLRRKAQELDLSIDAGTRRLDIAHADRAVAATRLVQAVANVRQLEDHAAPDDASLVQARLEAELAESTTAELDSIAELVELELRFQRAERGSIAKRLASAATALKPTPEEVAEIERRLSARSLDLQQRLAAAAKARDAVFDELRSKSATASPARQKALQERLTTRDTDIELIRERMSNLTIEQTAWHLAIRYWRDNDTGALVEARERGPATRDSIARRLEFMKASFDQFAAQSGALDAQFAQVPAAADAEDLHMLRDTMDERTRLIESGMLDERRVLALIDRLRADFDARIGAAAWKDRFSYTWESARRLASQIWNLELFVVDQTVDVDGRQTKVPRSVTVAKVVKAPLLLLVGLLIAFHLTRWIERYAQHRGVDAASARLTRRWTFGLLACACALSSLAIAGIPFAAFAFVGGAVAIGVGFGMQTLFKNLISGVLLLLERPFRLGDEIQVGDLRGTVVEIDLRTSVLRDADGSETLIPNSALVEQNVTARSRAVRQTLSVTVDAQSDPRKVSDTMREAVERHGLVDPSREPVVFLDEFPGAGLRFSMNYWVDTTPGTDRQRLASDLRLMILGAFNAAGIRLAQGQLDLRVHADDASKIADAVVS
jgi:potassium efflux system protein